MGTSSMPPIVYPDTPRTRRTDPISSHEAADATTSIIQASQLAVARIFENEHRPLTLNDIEQLGRYQYGLTYSDSRLRSACSELGTLGVLTRDGFIRRPGDKRRRQLWKLADA